jgi:hypothetical protein
MKIIATSRIFTGMANKSLAVKSPIICWQVITFLARPNPPLVVLTARIRAMLARFGLRFRVGKA